jgi:hypothetical protein
MKEKIKNLWFKYERWLSPAALLFGFVLDNFTLRRVDLWAENAVLLSYLVIAGSCIAYLNAHSEEKIRGKIFDKVSIVAPFLMQFAFGGLFSAFVVFYSRSASVFFSWPFLIFLLFFLIGNEFFKERYLRLVFQLNIYFIALFSYSIFAIPVLIGKMGLWIFVLSGITSVAFLALFVYWLYKMTPVKILQSQQVLAQSIGIIFIIFNFFYFTNIIPPIPLSLQEGIICRSVERVVGKYQIAYEPAPWYLFFLNYNPQFHWQSGDRVYAFSAVFAPTKLNTEIFHEWSYYDEEKNKWILKDEMRFNIVGGRDGGYRGYTYKTGIAPGKWRVNVLNGNGQILGTMKFEAVEGEPFEVEKGER